MNGITYALEIEPDLDPVRRNAMASSNAEFDRKVEDEILTRLDSGDTWAWCVVKVTAHYMGFKASSWLGGCSYENEEQFKEPGGYWEGMKKDARIALVDELERAAQALRLLHKEDTA